MRYVCLFLLVIGVCALPQVTDAELSLDDEDLQLYLPFNGDIQDYSTKENHGTLAGNEAYVDGKFDQAMEFAADIEVKCPYIEINERSFTVAMWVNPALAGGDQQCVFSQMDNNSTNLSLHYRIYTSGQVRMGFYSNDLDAPGAVAADEWAHIVFWHDSDNSTRRIYINGEVVAEDAGKSDFLGKKGDTIVGSWGTSGQKFNGIIDEVQLWTRALTEDEVKQSMDDLLTSFPRALHRV